MGEVLMFVRENIAQLVGQALGVAYPGIDVGVRMSVYPIVYAAIGDIVLQLYGERHVCLAALKLWAACEYATASLIKVRQRSCSALNWAWVISSPLYNIRRKSLITCSVK